MNGNSKRPCREIMDDRKAVSKILRTGPPNGPIARMAPLGEPKRLPVSAEAVADFFRSPDRKPAEPEL
jgi:hypothetical protein